MGKLLGLCVKSGCDSSHQNPRWCPKWPPKRCFFSKFSHVGVKDLDKYTHFYVVLLRSNLQSIIRL